MQKTALRLVLILALFAALPANAQEPDPRDGPEGPFVDTVDVNVVNVEVYVTDRQGNRVLGLERDDFELRVDGRPLPITYFYAVEGGKPRALPPAPVETPDDDLPPPPRAAAEEVPAEQRLYLVIYVDNFNLDPLHRNRLFSHLRTFLTSRLRPSDRVMVVSYDRPLRKRLGFTGDVGRVLDVLYELEDHTGGAARAETDRRELLDAIYEQANPDPREQVIARASVYAQSLHNDLQFTIDALKDLVDKLAGLPGRKAILYLSDGIAMRSGEDVFYAMQEHWGDSRFLAEANRYDASRRFAQLANQANAHRVTFYTIDAAGLRMHSYNNAENSGPTGGVAIDESHFANLQSPLHYLADETGGLAILNTNRFLPKLEQVAEDFETYYSLGFTPEATSNRYRDVRVRVNGRKGLVVRARSGFRDKPPNVRMADSTRAALEHGFAANDLGVEVELRSGSRDAKKNLYRVPVVVKIPIGKLSLIAQGGAYRGRVRLFVAAQDDGGKLAAVQEVPVEIAIPGEKIERARASLYHHDFTLLMRRGRQRLAVGVRDEIGDLSGFVTRDAEIGPSG